MSGLGFLLAHGGELALGSSLVLAAGALAVRLQRQPVLRRRTGLLTVAAVAGYLLLALAPLPRLLPPAPVPRAGTAEAPALLAEPRPAGPEAATAAVAADRLASFPARAGAPGRAARAATAAAVPAAPPRPALAPRLLALLYLAGAAGNLGWLLLGHARLLLLLARSRPAPAPLLELAALPPHADVRIAPRPVRPFCCGFLRAVVVLPPELARAERLSTARAVLRHEAAHLRAGDHRAQLLFALLAPLFWWQPLFHWLRRQVRFESELLADAAAAAGGVHAYVQAMLDLATEAPAAALPAAASVFHRPSEFYRRLQMLLRRDVPLSRSLSLPRRLAHSAAALGVAAACAGFFGVAPARAQEPAPESETALRAEIRDLNTKLAELRRLVAQLQRRAKAPVLDDVTPEAFQGAPSQPGPMGPLPKGPPTVVATVEAGDTLETVIRNVSGDCTPELVQRTLACNPGLDPSRLRVGQRVLVPALRDGVASAAAPAGAPLGMKGPGGVGPAQGVPAAAPPGQVGAASAPGGQAARGDHRLVDLLTVATRCIELRGQLQLAEVEVDSCKAEGRRTELAMAEIKLKTVAQQFHVAEQLVRGELEVLQKELGQTKQLRAAGMVGDADVARLANYVRALEGAL